MSRPKSKVVRVRVVGPLAPTAAPLRVLLRERGYSPLSRVTQLQVLQHLSKWLQARGSAITDVTDEVVEEYLQQRRADGYASFCSLAGLRQLLAVLDVCGAPLTGPAAGPASELDVLMAEYALFLRQERGLAASTTAAYVLRARRFLDGCGGVANIPNLTAAAVTGAVLRESQMLSAGSAQFFAVSLRALLRWCLLTGRLEVDLAGSSLPVTGRRRCTLPRGISDIDARALLRSCDRRTHAGRRDYAVILILLRLGLRAGEVAALRLDDVDWRCGCRKPHPRSSALGSAVLAFLG